MKNLLIISVLSFSFLFSSCNKKLKEEMKELEQDVEEQKNTNAALENQLNSLSSILGSDEPITAVTTFLDDDGVSRTYTDSYYLKSNDGSTQYMYRNTNGTYTIGIERFKDVNWNEGASGTFIYNPTNGSVSDIRLSHYWDWNISGYSDYAEYSAAYLPMPTLSVTINSIDVNTGELDVVFNASAVDGYNGYLPNQGKGATTRLTFKGKCGVFKYSF